MNEPGLRQPQDGYSVGRDASKSGCIGLLKLRNAA